MTELNLKSILKSKMAILFVPLNPPDISNSHGHYFSRVSTFWDILYDSELITQKIEDLMKADIQVFKGNKINYKNLTYGIADLVRVVESDSGKVKPNNDDLAYILSIIEEYKPKVVCLMHNKVRKAFMKGKIIPQETGYGIVGKHSNSILFAVPFPTGSNMSKEEVTYFYKDLKKLLDNI